MRGAAGERLRRVIVLGALPVAIGGCGEAASSHFTDPVWDVAQARGQTREIDFTTEEGTYMSLDVSPDGRWIAFDLLGHIYRGPVEGGEAECLTQASGVALNFHPAYSPNGTKIAFVSDRGGQNALWVMSAGGGDAGLVFQDPASRIADPEWTPAGDSIVAVRAFPTPYRGYHRVNTRIWLFPAEGGEGRELLGGELEQYNDPSFSPDGMRLYFHVSYFSRNRYGTQAGHHLRRQDRGTEEVEVLTKGMRDEERDPQYYQVPDQSAFPRDRTAEMEPAVSPDGRFLAYIREMPEETMKYRGHEVRPATALWIRDLQTGEDRVAMDPVQKDVSAGHGIYSYRTFPGYSWMPDGGSIVITEGGKLRRLDVATGEVAVIPFRARVHRVISQQTRGRVAIHGDSFAVKFLQWPASSPDGSRLAFVALGRIWIVDLPDGAPRPLTPDPGDGFQLTPAFSPDGQAIAYTTWNDMRRGQVWTAPAAGGEPKRLTDRPAEYLYPAWSPDGRAIVVASGPGARPEQLRDGEAPQGWNGWNAVGGWSILRIPAQGGAAVRLAEVGLARKAHFGPGARLYFQHQDNVAATAGLYEPYATEEALRQVVHLRSVDLEGRDVRDHLAFPPMQGEGNLPLLSPDGRWVAFQAAENIFLADVSTAAAADGDELPFIETDPNGKVPGVTRVGTQGGVFHRWRNATTLEFVSGNTYITYAPVSGELRRATIRLRAPRHIPDGSIALTGARIITLEGEQVIEAGTVLVERGRVACVGQCDSSRADTVIDISGKVVLPGFVDVHAHHTREPYGVIPQHRTSSALDLAYGVTTILDPASTSISAFPLADMTEAGLVTGPRTFSTAEIVKSPPWHDDPLDIRSYEDAVHHVNRRADWGAISIKNFRLARREQQQKLLEAARARGITVTGEGGPVYFDLGLAMDGQTGWEHAIAVLPIYGDVARFLGQAGMVYSPTALVAGHGKGSVEYWRPQHAFARNAKYRRFNPQAGQPAMRVPAKGASMTAVQPTGSGQAAARPDPADFSFPIIAEGLADIIRNGGYGAIGEHGEQNGIGSHWEVWSYAAALTPMEALRIATAGGAHFLGLEEELGSVRAGKLADLIVLNADPREDIKNTLNILYVMKNGRLYDDDTLDELWPRRRPYGPRPWSR